MRFAWIAPGLMVATTAACGGSVRPNPSGSAPTCGHGPSLVQTASSVILAPADVAIDVRGMSGFVELSPPVATPDGKTLLATWTAVDASGAVGGHAVLVRLASHGVVGTTAPVEAPTSAVAVFDGTDFVVVGRAGGPPVAPDAPTSVVLERIAIDGSAAAPPQTIETLPGPGTVSSAVWTPKGLAVAWWAFASSMPQTAVQLFSPDGLLIRGVTLNPLVNDPNTELMAAAPAAVALFHDQLVAANGHTVSTLDWLGGSAQTSRTKFTVSVPEKGGFPTLFETGGQLRIWGFGAGTPEGVYAGAPGESFSQVGSLDPSAITQRPDGCGGAVTLSNRNMALALAADSAPERTVPLGTTLPYVFDVAAMTTTPAGFAVAWVADDGMHLATLAWQ